MANELNIGAQRLASATVKSVKIETSLFEPIVMTGDQLFADTSGGVQEKASWVMDLVKPSVTIELSDSMAALGTPREIVIAPAGLPENHVGWMPLAIGAGLLGVGLFALGHYFGKRSR